MFSYQNFIFCKWILQENNYIFSENLIGMFVMFLSSLHICHAPNKKRTNGHCVNYFMNGLMTLRRSVKKKRLVSIDEARRFLLSWNQESMSDDQVDQLILFCEHVWSYLIEQFLAWKLK